MIQLHPIEQPSQLTDEKVEKWTQEFIETGKSVWNREYIKNALLEMSHSKCCYCECKVQKGGSYMEVEHFKPKKYYPQLVLQWENLLPACKRCNGQKSEHDTGKEAIIHPVIDEPNDIYLTRLTAFIQ